jgi:PRTRC genetic system protein E
MFFTSIQKLLEGAEAVTVVMVPADEGRVGVTVATRMKEKSDPILARPLYLIGTVEELDAEFAQLVGGQHASVRKTLAEQLAAATAEMQAAAKAKASTKPASTAKPAAPATPAAVSIADLEPDDESGEGGDDNTGTESAAGGTTPAAAAPAAPAGGLDLASLL